MTDKGRQKAMRCWCWWHHLTHALSAAQPDLNPGYYCRFDITSTPSLFLRFRTLGNRRKSGEGVDCGSTGRALVSCVDSVTWQTWIHGVVCIPQRHLALFSLFTFHNDTISTLCLWGPICSQLSLAQVVYSGLGCVVRYRLRCFWQASLTVPR